MLQLIVLAVSFLSILYSSGCSLVNAAKFRDRGGVKLREGSSGKKKLWGRTHSVLIYGASIGGWSARTKPLHLCPYSTVQVRYIE